MRMFLKYLRWFFWWNTSQDLVHHDGKEFPSKELDGLLREQNIFKSFWNPIPLMKSPCHQNVQNLQRLAFSEQKSCSLVMKQGKRKRRPFDKKESHQTQQVSSLEQGSCPRYPFFLSDSGTRTLSPIDFFFSERKNCSLVGFHAKLYHWNFIKLLYLLSSINRCLFTGHQCKRTEVVLRQVSKTEICPFWNCKKSTFKVGLAKGVKGRVFTITYV